MTEPDQAEMATVHHAFVAPLLATGRLPSRADVAANLKTDLVQLDGTLDALAQSHGVVLDPHSGEPWVIHPFSVTPTATWVEHAGRGWWAPCPWCAFGIAGLAGGNATIHTRLAGEREPITITVRDGEVVEDDLLVHFAVPPRSAWDNVHRFCATVLPFRNRTQVDEWCHSHGIERGEVAPISQIWALGRDWYARHADADWTKWTGAEAAAIFERVGLTDPFWRFNRTNEPF